MEIKFEFVFKNENSKEVIISQPYTLKQIMDLQVDDIREHSLTCDCQPVGETNVVECNCEDYYDEFEQVAERQFTGLKDKNGEEIYHGDILAHHKAEDEVVLVNWHTGYASFCLDKKGWAFSHFFGEAGRSDEFIIIGNLYQNPELLNKK